MSAGDATVYVVEDDDALRSLVTALVHSMGLACRTFASASQFPVAPPTCRARLWHRNTAGYTCFAGQVCLYFCGC
jgi:hypothetical protein